MTYQFKTDVFEGPLDLLLFLIKEQKMDINDIPISTITRQYLSYLAILQELNLDLAGEYLVMAAELTRIKSRELLPFKEAEDAGEDEAGYGEDPKDALMRRLLEYRRYKEAAFELRRREFERGQIYCRQGEAVVNDDPEGPLMDVTLFDLLTAYQKILNQKSFKKDYEVKITTLSVSDRIKYIMEILNVSESMTFESLFTAINTRQEIIVLFLAILELMRLRLIRVQQTSYSDPLRIYKNADKKTQDEILQNHLESEGAEETKHAF
ncbi:MAG: segregation and condensation protein A [Nitrospinae bacterium RIFCSPLOWO2_12_FULL_47_7]|nr:MAG: segregation and condensation protein A [Nitrospinae bacterium RIFCSPLOWO2_12_FULL_47_7]